LAAIADAHAQLSKNLWDAVDLAELVRHQLSPTATDANTTIEGTNVRLTVAATQALGMVLHELVTNAAKYGALSTPHGRVEVTWDYGSGPDSANLILEWREIGGPAVSAVFESKYGVSVIRQLIPQELGSSVELRFEAAGVYCRIAIPLESVRDGSTAILQVTSLKPLDVRLREAVSP
jgi:two-component sensor histidine kinase